MSAIPMTIGEALADAGREHAEALLMKVLQVGRAFLYAHPEHRLQQAQALRYHALRTRLRNGVPLAYLLGRCEFWTLSLQVSRDTLVPRPETEHLVEAALEHLCVRRPTRMAELGTGTGAVALAIAAERPRAQIIATDNCKRALQVARHNAMHMGCTRIRFRHGDWCRALYGRPLDLIVSNPPYVEAGAYRTNRTLHQEPRQALYGGPDGLRALRHLVRTCPAHLHTGAWLLLEHGALQGGRVRALLRRHGYRDIHTLHDLAGHERISGARCPPR